MGSVSSSKSWDIRWKLCKKIGREMVRRREAEEEELEDGIDDSDMD